MRCFMLAVALVATTFFSTSAKAAFVPTAGSSGPVGAAGYENTLDWLVTESASVYTYYYQLSAPTAGQTTSFEVDAVTSGLLSWGTIGGMVIDVGGATLVSGLTNTNPITLDIDADSIGMSGALGNTARPTQILFFTSAVSPNFLGTGLVTQAGDDYSFTGLAQPVPVPAAGVLALVGLPFFRLASRRLSRR